MDQKHKTDSQERDALLREILDDTSPNRPTAKPPQRPPGRLFPPPLLKLETLLPPLSVPPVA